ncbi:MAG: hypothetical protein M3Y18_09590 [Candidatus Eremiobacteraeota bacterium]|nr:hypothetical protein [Candidatus Eremiobacteraeota bacterium]
MRGTPLEAQLGSIASELHLTPDSAEWTFVALGLLANEGIRGERERMEQLAASVPQAVRAELQRVLESEFSNRVRDAVVQQAVPAILAAARTQLAGVVENSDKSLTTTIGKTAGVLTRAALIVADAESRLSHMVAAGIACAAFALVITFGATLWLDRALPSGAYHVGFADGAAVERHALRVRVRR